MEATKANVPTIKGFERSEEFTKFSDAIGKLNELIDYAPEADRDKMRASVLAKLTDELNAFIQDGEAIKKHAEENYDHEVEFFTEMINKVISDEMKIIRKKYSLSGETLPDFFSLEFHGYRASIIEHINSTILSGTRFLLVVKRTQVESAIVEGFEGTGYRPKEKSFDVHYRLVLVDKFRDLDQEPKKETINDAPPTAKKPAKKVTKKK